MSVEYGTYDDSPTLEAGSIVAREADAWLISDAEGDTDTVRLSDIDQQPGRVRIHQQAETEADIAYTDMRFENFYNARLAFGLWTRYGPFTQPEGHAVPMEIATDGQAAVAAYLRVNNGYPRSRSAVADMMNVAKQTVSNYCRTVRWTPD